MTSHPIDSIAASGHAAGGAVPFLAWLSRAAVAVVRRFRNAAAAEWLEELPPYLLDDIGIDRRGIEDIRTHGRPRTVGRRRVADIDRPASRP